MTDIINSVQWLSEPVAYWTLQYEYRRSGADMQYRFYWKIWLKSSSSWYYDTLQLRLYVNGVQYNIQAKPYNTTKGWSYDGTTGWYTVANKTSGTTSFWAEIYDVEMGKVRSSTKPLTLAVSPTGATILTAPNFTDEQNPTITYTNPAGASVTSLEACISLTGSKDDVAYRAISKTGTSYTFTLTEAERNVLRNATAENTRTVFFYVKTVVDGVTFHSSLEKTLSIWNASPDFDDSQISYTDTNHILRTISGVASDDQKIVQNKSSLSVTFGSAVGKKGATITKYTLELNGVKKTATTSGTVSFGVINSSQDVRVRVTAEDSRGNSTSVEKDITVIPYSVPIITATLQRVNNYEDETHLTIDASIASVDGKNSINVIQYKYAESGGSFGSPVNAQNKTEYTLSLDNEKSFVFSITVADAFGSATKEFTLSKGKFPLFIDTEKNAVGINEFPERGEALRVRGGVGSFDDGIVLCSTTKKFLLTINDNGALNTTLVEAPFGVTSMDVFTTLYSSTKTAYSFAETGATLSGRLKSVTMWSNNGTVNTKIAVAHMNGSTITSVDEIAIKTKNGKQTYINGVDFVYDGTINVGDLIGFNMGVNIRINYGTVDAPNRCITTNSLTDLTYSQKTYGFAISAVVGSL